MAEYLNEKTLPGENDPWNTPRALGHDSRRGKDYKTGKNSVQVPLQLSAGGGDKR